MSTFQTIVLISTLVANLLSVGINLYTMRVVLQKRAKDLESDLDKARDAIKKTINKV